ncbi:MAG: hypothetical protein PGMFKBFP_00411 [Anaerolineales bacterium]|nr:hypothetical protein [Anaerolineales bacterium]
MGNAITHIDKAEQERAGTAITRAHEVVLKTEEDMGWASDDLATLRKLRKDFEKKLKDLCQPFKDGIEALKAEFDTIINPLKSAEGVIDGKITACRRALQAEADKLKREQEAAQREAERLARLANQPPPPPPPPVLDAARGFKVPTTGAKTGVMKVAKWRVVDESKVPMTIIDQYGNESEPLWVLHEGAITRIRKAAGMDAASSIPGIEFYYDETNTVR